MITYSDIYESARKERYSDQLQPLQKNFVEEFAIYIKEKKQLTADKEDDFSDNILKTKKQLENAMTLFKELLLRRRKKILSLVLIATETGIAKADFENMLSFEKELFESIMKCMDFADKKLNESFNGEKKHSEQKNQLVLFIEEAAEFLDLSGEKLGPFERGQIANIPKEIAQILIDDGKCELLEK